MADQEQSHTARRETEKTPRDMTGKVGERHASEGDLSRAQSCGKPGGTVGRDVPDESKV